MWEGAHLGRSLEQAQQPDLQAVAVRSNCSCILFQHLLGRSVSWRHSAASLRTKSPESVEELNQQRVNRLESFSDVGRGLFSTSNVTHLSYNHGFMYSFLFLLMYSPYNHTTDGLLMYSPYNHTTDSK